MPAHGAGQRYPLGVAADGREVFRAAGVVDPGYFLLDDRALVQVGGDVVRGRADQLHAVRVRLVVGPRALEARQERMVNVDDPARQLGAQLRRQDTHVPGQHHEVDAQLADQVQQPAYGPLRGQRIVRIDGHVLEGDAVR